MGWKINVKGQKLLIVTPSLPESFPFVSCNNGYTYIKFTGENFKRYSYKEWRKGVEARGYFVETFDSLFGGLLIEVASNTFLFKGSVIKASSLSNFLKEFGYRKPQDKLDRGLLKCEDLKSVVLDLVNNPYKRKHVQKQRKQSRNTKKYAYNGVEYRSLSELGRVLGIPRSTLCSRINDCGMSIDEAVKSVGTRSVGSVDHLGNSFKTKASMCEYWGVDPDTFGHRVKRGWSLKEALTGKKYKSKQK